LPVAVIFLDIPNKFVFIGTGVLIGEIIDRCEFYIELDIITPQKQMLLDFKKSLENIKS
jgi:hypothetical protein